MRLLFFRVSYICSRVFGESPYSYWCWGKKSTRTWGLGEGMSRLESVKLWKGYHTVKDAARYAFKSVHHWLWQPRCEVRLGIQSYLYYNKGHCQSRLRLGRETANRFTRGGTNFSSLALVLPLVYHSHGLWQIFQGMKWQFLHYRSTGFNLTIRRHRQPQPAVR